MYCDQCGVCCRHYTGTNWARPEDMLRWYDEGRQDILRFVSLRTMGTGKMDASRLSREDLASLPPLHGWTDPDTGRELQTCPFLLRAEDGKYYCRIHPTKPLTCRNFEHEDWEMFLAYRTLFME